MSVSSGEDKWLCCEANRIKKIGGTGFHENSLIVPEFAGITDRVDGGELMGFLGA